MKYLTFFLLVFIAACSGSFPRESALKKGILMAQFNEYSALAGTPAESVFLSADFQAFLKKSRARKKEVVASDMFRRFPSEIMKITDHKESIQANTGCLMVSGTNSKNTPMDYYITYKRDNKRWVIEKMGVKYFYDGTERYLTKAVCEMEERQNLWLEHIERNQ